MCQLKCQKSQPTVKLKVPGETQKVGWKVTFQALSIKETFSLCCPNNGKNSERVWGQKEASKRLCVRLNHWRSSWGGLVRRRLEGKRGLCYFRVANPSDLWGATISSSPSNELLLPIRNKYCHYKFSLHFLVAFDSTRGNLWPGWLSTITFLFCSLKIFW